MGARDFLQFGRHRYHTLRKFMSSVLTVNEKLNDSGHKRLDVETLDLMVEEVCDMLFGPEEEHLNVGEPAQDLHQE